MGREARARETQCRAAQNPGFAVAPRAHELVLAAVAGVEGNEEARARALGIARELLGPDAPAAMVAKLSAFADSIGTGLMMLDKLARARASVTDAGGAHALDWHVPEWGADHATKSAAAPVLVTEGEVA